ncbi:MAG: phosphohydrolase [Pseudomonadota bacterium]
MMASPTSARPWMQTASGRVVYLDNPDPASISIRDIAAHLAKLCRFAGAADRFYSVAQHSVLVCRLCADAGPHGQMHALLHDAHEAYIGDITQPVKRALAATAPTALIELERRLDRAIADHVGLSQVHDGAFRETIHHADLRALATEKRDLMPDLPDWTGHLPAPWRSTIKPWPWPKAEEQFLKHFDDLAAMCGMPDRMSHAGVTA